MPRHHDTLDSVSPYVKRALGDDEIRKNVTRAFKAARKVYGELSGEDASGVAGKLKKDESVREDLGTTVNNLSEALVRMSGKEPKKRGSWTPVVMIAVAAFVFFNPATGASTRAWIRDHLLGSDEEFDYSTPEY